MRIFAKKKFVALPIPFYGAGKAVYVHSEAFQYTFLAGDRIHGDIVKDNGATVDIDLWVHKTIFDVPREYIDVQGEPEIFKNLLAEHEPKGFVICINYPEGARTKPSPDPYTNYVASPRISSWNTEKISDARVFISAHDAIAYVEKSQGYWESKNKVYFTIAELV